MVITERLEASLDGNKLELDHTKTVIASAFTGSDVSLQATHLPCMLPEFMVSPCNNYTLKNSSAMK